MLIKLLLLALVLLSVMFLGLVWWVAILAKITLALPAAVTGLFVVVLLGVLVIKRLRAQSAASGLEKGLRAEAQAQQKHMRPDLQHEAVQMQEDFERAVLALKSSRGTRGGRGGDVLYQLPWYAIIGPSGAGKTTALRHSGLRFPQIKGARDVKVRGLGGTRNCDWWLTNEAVLLDTAGRWATQEEDHDEWLGFLRMLKKYRPRKPLNGLIAAVSIGDIVNAKDDEVEELARRMRERLDEVIGQLHVSLPVYVLLTKCDLIEGFVETFGDLSTSERDQVWGFTAALAQDMGEPGAYFEERFDELAQVLEPASLLRMGAERRVDSRQFIYAFPQQFVLMRRNLSSFMTALFEKSIYHETPSLRGVYFTSGTQEGRPFSLLLNRLASSLASSMGLQDRLAPAATPGDSKSYFLRNLFMKVIFEDQELASASQGELRRQRIVRGVLTSALLLVAAVVSLIPSYAYSKSRIQLDSTATLVESWERRAADPARRRQLVQPIALQAVVGDLAGYESDAPSWVTTLGMYQGDRVLPPLRRHTANLLRRELLQPLIAADMQSLTEFGFRYASQPRSQPSVEEHARHYDQLKLHLLLSSPRSEGEPELDDAQRTWLVRQLATRWAAADPKKRPATLAAAETLARRSLQYLSDYPELLFGRDADVVRRTREALTRLPLAQHELDRVVARAAEEGYDLNLAKLVGRSHALIGTKGIASAFTRRGWENLVRDQLDAGALEHAGELWVLGLADRQSGSQQVQAQLDALRTLYFQAYVQEWKSFVQSLRINAPDNSAAALALLVELSQGEPPPLALLMHKVHANLQLKPKATAETTMAKTLDTLTDKIKHVLGDGDDAAPPAGAKQPVDAAKRKPDTQAFDTDRFTAADVAASFEDFTSFAVRFPSDDGTPSPPPPYNAYHEQLTSVRDALQLQLDNPQESDALFSRLQIARARVRTLIDGQDPAWRPVFEALLWPPIEGAAISTHRAVADSAARRWCSEVVTAYDRGIRGSYPFDSRGHDLPLDAFATFYRPNEGVLWRFYKDALANTVQLNGDNFAFATRMGRDAGSIYQASLLEFLKSARDVTSVFFAPGNPEPSVALEVMIHPSPLVATTTFSVGGKQVEYHNGPEQWQTVSWPGTDPLAGAAFVVRGANGMNEQAKQEGTWGLFRLLEAGTVTRSSSKVFSVAWQLQTHDVTLKVDFRPVRSESPFFGVPGRTDRPRLFQPLRTPSGLPPAQITHSAAACHS
jgi:type VI secretion system protein ImpL